MQTFLIPTSNAEYLAKKIQNLSKEMNIIIPEKNPAGKCLFADGEVYSRIPGAKNLKGKRVVVLHSGAPNPNSGLVELELILQILNENKIKPEIFFSYFPYARQDNIFEEGETNAAENLIKKLVNYYSVKKIYIIDPHFAQRQWVKKYPLACVSAVPLLKENAQAEFGKDIVFMSPDKGGQRRTGISGAEKQRNKGEIEMLDIEADIKGKVVAAVDDLIGSGGTLIKFKEKAKEAGAKEVIALATHGVIPEGVAKVKSAFSKFYLANTINLAEANVDVTELIVNTLYFAGV